MNHPKGVSTSGVLPSQDPRQPPRSETTSPKHRNMSSGEARARPPARPEDPDGPTTSEGEVVVAAGTGVHLNSKSSKIKDGRGFHPHQQPPKNTNYIAGLTP